ncbi:MAG: hypothetical protein CM15mP103_10080 [Gammaproteobacteria bacterium]|nr:MAG: hypothetical protein CM15mP103_10080 [Gammaproteobacteria bacterium]
MIAGASRGIRLTKLGPAHCGSVAAGSPVLATEHMRILRTVPGLFRRKRIICCG